MDTFHSSTDSETSQNQNSNLGNIWKLSSGDREELCDKVSETLEEDLDLYTISSIYLQKPDEGTQVSTGEYVLDTRQVKNVKDLVDTYLER